MPPGVSFCVTMCSMQNGAESSHHCAFFPVVSSVSWSLVGDIKMSSGVSGSCLVFEFAFSSVFVSGSSFNVTCVSSIMSMVTSFLL